MDAMRVSAVGMAAAMQRFGDGAGRIAGASPGLDGKPADPALEAAAGMSDVAEFRANAAVLTVSADLAERTLDVIV